MNFIKEVVASDDEEVFKLVLSWTAGLVTNLKSINKTALVLQSLPGTGKNTFTEFLRFVLGQHCIYEATGVGSIAQKHNSIIQGKRLIVVNELSSTRAEFHSQFDKIKSYITDKTVIIEPKNVNQYSIENIGNYIYMTNHKDSMVIEQGDRRYHCIEVSTKYINHWDYFGLLREKCFNQATADAFYTFLLDYKAEPLYKIVETQLRKDMMQLSKPSTLKFIDEFVDHPEEFFVNDEEYHEQAGKELFKKSRRIQASEFFSKYVRWCKESNEKPISQTKFGLIVKEMSKIIIKEGRYYKLVKTS